MVKFNVSLTGLDAFDRQWNRAIGAIAQSCSKGALGAAQDGLEAANKAIHSVSGELVKSGTARIVSENQNRTRAIIRWTKYYASYLDLGTVAHTIGPKFQDGVGPLNKGQTRRGPKDIGTYRIKLRYLGPGGTWIFRRSVWHPGTKAAYFSNAAIEPAIERVLLEVTKGIQRAESIMRAR